MLDWIDDHGVALTWLTIASVVMFVGTLVAVPAIVVRIPHDYFTHEKRPPGLWANRHPVLRITLLIVRNIIGVVFILIGRTLLALPGQGLLTILVGFFMLHFPAKYRLEKWLVSRPRICASINWFRKRRGRLPLTAPHARPS